MKSASPARVARPGVSLFDLDGTLTWHDTLRSFLTGYLRRHPRRWPHLWRLVPALLGYLRDQDRGRLKSSAIRVVMGGAARRDVDEWADAFVAGLRARGMFRPAALAAVERERATGNHLVLLSASPDLYVPRIGRLLGFECTLCTEVKWREDAAGAHLDGALLTANRHGEEKSVCLAWLRQQYPGLPVRAFGNSQSDLPHMRLADSALLVNADRRARRTAAALGMPVADWR
jgi:phosphatidylglycerophosphatase C